MAEELEQFVPSRPSAGTTADGAWPQYYVVVEHGFAIGVSASRRHCLFHPHTMFGRLHNPNAGIRAFPRIVTVWSVYPLSHHHDIGNQPSSAPGAI